MKQTLLLAAIYSLIIHQSRKNAKESTYPPAQKTITNAATLPIQYYQRQMALRNTITVKPEYASNTSQSVGAALHAVD